MKKRVVVFALILFLLITGCSNNKETKLSNIKNVSINISNVSSSGATILIKDTNKNPYKYEEWYEIEAKINNKWVKVNPIIKDYGFNLVKYNVNENNEVKFIIDWEWLYGKLEPGNYRLLKRVNNKYIGVEFNIEK
ncbi:MAG: hypothetical protein Q4E69_02225 [Bacilli bacterium]|nr:hypothetical protein [Bacilli bacterium]